MIRFFLSIHRVLMGHRRLVAACLFVLVALAALLALRMNYEEDIARFLPRNEQNQRYSEVYEGLTSQNRIVIAFTGEDTDSIEEAVEHFGEIVAELDSTQLLTDVQTYVDETKMLDVMEFVYANIPYFMTEGDWKMVDSLLAVPDYVATQMDNNKQMLMLPTAGSAMETMRYDPLHLFGGVLKRMQSFKMSNQYEMVDGFVFCNEGKTALAFASSPFGISESLNNNRIAHLLKEAIAQNAEAYPTVKSEAVGAPLIAVGNANRIKTDSLIAVAISLTIILLLLIFHYRSLADLLWIGASILFGWLFAIAGMSVLRDTVSIIVLGIGSIIIGIAVNYPLHYLDHLNETVDRKKTLRDMVPPLLIGNITTVSAFACLVWLDAAAMRDLGLFGSLMLIGTILFVLVFMPLYAKAGKHAAHERLNINLDFLKLEGRKQRRWFILVVTVLTLVLGWFSLQTSFDSDIRNINYMTDSQRETLQLITPETEDAQVYVVAEGKNLDEALHANESMVLPKLESLLEEGKIITSSGVGHFLPSEEMQQTVLQRWDNYWKEKQSGVLASLRQEAQRQGFAAGSFEPFEQMVTEQHQPQQADFFAPIRDYVAESFILNSDSVTRVVNLVTTKDEMNVKSVVGQEASSNVFAFSTKDISNQLVRVLSDNFNYIGFICGFVVFVFLWLSFGRLELSLLSFLPLAVSWLWILGTMHLFDVKFNIVNIILATFIFGQGDDYTIFITEGLVAEYATGQKRLDSYKRSVALSAVIMFVGIGSLIIARHPALRSLAQVTVIGMLTVVLMAFYLPPLVFRWLTRTGDGSLRAVPLTLKRFGYSLFSISFFLLFIYLFMKPFTWLWFHLGKVTEKRKYQYHCVLRRMSDFIIHRVPGVKFSFTNPNAEDFSKPAVIVCNHQSHLDLMCLMMMTPKIVFLTNDWVWNNPFYGNIIHRAEFYPVSNGVENSIELMKDLFRRGYSIMVFPEGTRSPDCKILRFHKGAFMLARELGADVLPVYIHGAGHVLPKKDFMLREGRIDVEVGQRMDASHPIFEGTLLESTKRFRHFYMEQFETFRKRIETPEYFVPYVRYQYMYKGTDVERRSKSLLRQAVAELKTMAAPAGKTMVMTDEGQGEKALLTALVYPEVEVTAQVADENDYLVAAHMAGSPQNLHFTRK